MSPLGPCPPEPPRNHDAGALCPWFAAQLAAVIATANAELAGAGMAYRFQLFEGLRTDARQKWLYGSGRTYAGRWLTNADSCFTSWHGYGLAADVVPRTLNADGTLGDFTWDGPDSLWLVLYRAAHSHGCTTGYTWPHRDEDHVQPLNVRIAPSPRACELYQEGGLPAVWKACQPGT